MSEQEVRPNFERLTNIVMDHLFFAERYPEKIEEIAKRLKVSRVAALAVAITDQITEEFAVTKHPE